jgi:hypothetical protein
MAGFQVTTEARAEINCLSNAPSLAPVAALPRPAGTLNFTRVITRTNEPQVGFGKLSSFGFISGPGTLGIVPSVPNLEGLPQINLQNFSIGNPGTTIEPNNIWRAANNFSKIYGRHSLKFGGEFRYYQLNERTITAANGSLTFNGSETDNDFADYLLGKGGCRLDVFLAN